MQVEIYFKKRDIIVFNWNIYASRSQKKANMPVCYYEPKQGKALIIRTSLIQATLETQLVKALVSFRN